MVQFQGLSQNTPNTGIDTLSSSLMEENLFNRYYSIAIPLAAEAIDKVIDNNTHYWGNIANTERTRIKEEVLDKNPEEWDLPNFTKEELMVLNYIKVKSMTHPVEVLEAGRDLVSNLQIDSIEKSAIDKILLMHDIGRFDGVNNEGKITKESDENNHGMWGYEILKRNSFSNKLLLLAVKHHRDRNDELLLNDNEYENLPQEQQEEAYKYFQIIQDADRLPNLFAMFEHQSNVCAMEPKDPYIKDGAIKELKNCEMVSTKNNVRSYFDKMVMYISWCTTMHFPESRHIVQEKHIVKDIIGNMYNEFYRTIKTTENSFSVEDREKFLNQMEEITNYSKERGLLSRADYIELNRATNKFQNYKKAPCID